MKQEIWVYAIFKAMLVQNDNTYLLGKTVIELRSHNTLY